MDKQRIVYYDNELTDDFAGNNIKQKKLGPRFKYIHRNIFWRFGSWFAYYFIAWPILGLIGSIKFGVRIKGRKNLKSLRKTGFFVYGNHSCWGDSFFTSTKVVCPKRAYIIANPDAVSLPFLKNFVQMIGATPLPDSYQRTREFLDCINYRLKKKQVIIIFPEAHIWPYYTGLRDFSSSSFFYPVKTNKPVIALAGTWRAPKKAGKKPRITLHISTPFYPDANLDRKEAEQKLRDQVYKFLKDKTSSKDNYEYIRYVKRDKASV